MPHRFAVDGCPSAVRLRQAEDGWLARVRVPGGLVGRDGLHALAAVADDLADGRLELTSRGNVQLRTLAADAADELSGRLHAAGLMPDPELDGIRNVVASPLAGVDTGVDLTGLVRALDAALLADQDAARLPGRFLFGIDDGRGDIAALAPDVLAVVRADTAWVEGVTCRPDEVVGWVLTAVRGFFAERGEQHFNAWRVDDFGGHGGGHAGVRRHFTDNIVGAAPVAPTHPDPPAGRVPRADGGTALVVLPPLGRLSADQARWIADRVGDAPATAARITPWRSVLLPHAPADDARDVGLVVDAESPWRLVSACTGRPGCAKALADVRADATAALADRPGVRLHWAGCDRCCGRTAEVEQTLVATPTGYRVEDRVA